MPKRPFTSRYLVDTVPTWLRPFHDAFTYVFALSIYLFSRMVLFTSRIEKVGRERIEESENRIYCYWHVYSPMAVTAFFRPRRHVWMNHPGWLNKHMQVVVRLLGAKVVLGSTGHGGREAADLITQYLRAGYSTVVFPDAPRGPPYELKDGVLHMSLQSGVPIVPVRFGISSSVTLKGWDRKKLPMPFGTIRIEFKEPIHVTEDTFAEAREKLIEALGIPEG